MNLFVNYDRMNGTPWTRARTSHQYRERARARESERASKRERERDGKKIRAAETGNKCPHDCVQTRTCLRPRTHRTGRKIRVPLSANLDQRAHPFEQAEGAVFCCGVNIRSSIVDVVEFSITSNSITSTSILILRGKRRKQQTLTEVSKAI